MLREYTVDLRWVSHLVPLPGAYLRFGKLSLQGLRGMLLPHSPAASLWQDMPNSCMASKAWIKCSYALSIHPVCKCIGYGGSVKLLYPQRSIESIAIPSGFSTNLVCDREEQVDPTRWSKYDTYIIQDNQKYCAINIIFNYPEVWELRWITWQLNSKKPINGENFQSMPTNSCLTHPKIIVVKVSLGFNSLLQSH